MILHKRVREALVNAANIIERQQREIQELRVTANAYDKLTRLILIASSHREGYGHSVEPDAVNILRDLTSALDKEEAEKVDSRSKKYARGYADEPTGEDVFKNFAGLRSGEPYCDDCAYLGTCRMTGECERTKRGPQLFDPADCEDSDAEIT